MVRLNRANLVFGLIAWLGILHFAWSVFHAISIYPNGYSITENFLSDLGRTETLTGSDNTICASIFGRAVMVLGISLIPFFAVMPTVIDQGRAVLRVSGILSAIGLIGIGLTPYDHYFVAHHAALGLWIGPLLLMVVTFFVYAKLGRVSSMILSIGTLSIVFATGAYAFAGSHSGQVVFQKILAILAAFWFCLVFVTVSISTIHSISSRRLIAEQQAIEYLEVIRQNHRRHFH